MPSVGKCHNYKLQKVWADTKNNGYYEHSQSSTPYKGAFNNYVDKMRGGEGQKMSVFVHAQGIKTVHAGGRGEGCQKMAKFCPRSC